MGPHYGVDRRRFVGVWGHVDGEPVHGGAVQRLPLEPGAAQQAAHGL